MGDSGASVNTRAGKGDNKKRPRRRPNPWGRNLESQMHNQIEQIRVSLFDLAENQSQVCDQYNELIRLREEYLQQKANGERDDKALKSIVTLARKTINLCKRSSKRNTLLEVSHGPSHQQAEDLFLDDTSLGSLSSTEMEVGQESKPTKQQQTEQHQTTSSAKKKAPDHKREAKEKSKATKGKNAATMNGGRKECEEGRSKQGAKRQERGTRADKKPQQQSRRKRKPQWWHKLTDVDPITVEPLSDLPYPPFAIVVSPEVTHYFDGKMLAHYVVSTGNFSNPNNRQPFTRNTCLELDKYLAENRLPQARVTEAFDLSKTIKIQANSNRTDDEAQRHIEAIRRDATVMLNSLFDFSGSRSSASNRFQPIDHARRGYTNTRAASSVVHNEGNLRVIDRDEWNTVDESALLDEEEFPAMPSSRPAPSNYFQPSNRSNSAMYPPLVGSGVSNTAVAHVPTPVEQTSAPSWPGRGTRAVNPSSLQPTTNTSTGWQGPSMAKVVATTKKAPAPTATSQGQSMDSGRPKLVFKPLSKPSSRPAPAPGHSLLDTSTAKSIKHLHDETSLLCPYVPSFIETARSVGLNFVAQLERELIAFVRSPPSVRSKTLPVMGASERGFAHALARDYFGLDTASVDPEPKRQVVVFRTTYCSIPEFTVTQAMLQFGQLLDLQQPGVSEAFKERPVSRQNTPSVALFHVDSGGGRIAIDRIEQVLSSIVRANAFTVRRLSSDSVLLEFTERNLARKTWYTLRNNAPHGLGGLVWKLVQWWPVSEDWAVYQLNMFERADKVARQKEKEEKRLLAEAQRFQQQRQTTLSGWDDDDSATSLRKNTDTKTSVKTTQGQHNLWDYLAEDDSDDE